jgi:hypothetical protein
MGFGARKAISKERLMLPLAGPCCFLTQLNGSVPAGIEVGAGESPAKSHLLFVNLQAMIVNSRTIIVNELTSLG